MGACFDNVKLFTPPPTPNLFFFSPFQREGGRGVGETDCLQESSEKEEKVWQSIITKSIIRLTC